MSFLFACFGRPTPPPVELVTPLEPLPPASTDLLDPDCVFCQIGANVEPARILFEDESFLVFQDRDRGARQHLLCIPRGHIAVSIKDLSFADVPLLERMGGLTRRIIAERAQGGEVRLGFHIPPFTSVPHIHLHAFELPFANLKSKIEFRSTDLPHGRAGKGFGWFVSLEQAIHILEGGGRVKVAATRAAPSVKL